MDPRQAYEQKAQAELELLGAGLDCLQARAPKGKADAAINQQKHMAELKTKREAAQEYLAQLNRADKFAWGELQVEADRAVSELRSALDQAALHLKYSDSRVGGGWIMKMTLVVFLFVSIMGALSLAGCGDDGKKKVTAEQVKKESSEALDTAVAYTKQKQEELMAKAKAQYQELEKDTSELMGKAKEQAAAGQDKAKEVLADLQKQQAVVQERLKAMESSSGKAWEKAKVELEEALQNLKQAYQKAKEELAS